MVSWREGRQYYFEKITITIGASASEFTFTIKLITCSVTIIFIDSQLSDADIDDVTTLLGYEHENLQRVYRKLAFTSDVDNVDKAKVLQDLEIRCDKDGKIATRKMFLDDLKAINDCAMEQLDEKWKEKSELIKGNKILLVSKMIAEQIPPSLLFKFTTSLIH